MRTLSAEFLKQIGVQIFTACGASMEEARLVVDELVCTNLMGFDSHGVIRYLQYTDDIVSKKILPGAPAVILKETGSTAIVDCNHNFGQVSANRITDIAYEKARQSSIACVVSVHCQHVGRLGSYVGKLAERGMMGIATVSSAKHGHWVAPWGGREGRLATNPIAYALPTSTRPIVMDMSTSSVPEGKIRVLKSQGKSLPEGSILDSAGNPSTDPNDFYGPPRGVILPFGGKQGYKGFGLGLLVEILGSVLSGRELSDIDYVNGLCIIAINPEAFCGTEQLKYLADELSMYMESCPPAQGFDEVVMPGTPEYRTMEQRLRDGIPIDDGVWNSIMEAANKAGVKISLPTD